jgi:hypothetical protein
LYARAQLRRELRALGIAEQPSPIQVRPA